jgi:CelD/BcsL family acetyltransferase involved in cellulose biosynthesis
MVGGGSSVVRCEPSIPLRIHAVDGASLSETQVQHWNEIQRSDSNYASPFLTPGYTQLVARCCEGVRVGIIELAQGRPVGFFPFQLVAPRYAKPVGTIFCDYQAVIIEPDVRLNAPELLAACGLDRWDFDHLLANQPFFSTFHEVHDFSSVIDLSAGFDVYNAQMKRDKRFQLSQAELQRRRMERELGVVTLSTHEPDPELLDRLLLIKREQWTRSGWPNRFEAEWELTLMANLTQTDEPNFGGLLTVLRAGNQPVALHLGLRSRTVWHYWTTAYEIAFARYSPGLVMLVEMIKSAESMGFKAIDLGKGDLLYKRRLRNFEVPLAEGTVRS